MRTESTDTRSVRSHDAGEALSFQLERVRGEADLDALVLATAEGLPVAHSGEDELCEELAALAPFMSSDKTLPSPGTTRVCTLTLDALPLLLVSYRRDAAAQADGWLEHASRGIERILAV